MFSKRPKNKTFIKLLWCLPVLMLSGCQSTPDGPLTIAPVIDGVTTQAPIAIEVLDKRPQHHIIRIERSGHPAEFATSQQPLATLISDAYQHYYSVDEGSPRLLSTRIQTGLCVAQQARTRHEVTCQVVIDAVVNTPGGQLTKSFTARRTREGAMNLKPNDVAGDFTHLLSQVLTEISRDSAIREWLSETPPSQGRN